MNSEYIKNYFIAKSNGDSLEASKCMTLLFEPVCLLSQNSQKCTELGLTSMINQVREELLVLISELKTNHLKLKASSAPASLASRQTSTHSPILSPKLRLTSDERTTSRESISKGSEVHILSSSRMMFYNQLFEHLDASTQKAILIHFINNSDNQFESCRLMMLGLTLMSNEFKEYTPKLLKILVDIADQTGDDNSTLGSSNPRAQMMCRYARNLLVLDVIPLALNFIDLNCENVDCDQLFRQTLRLFSDQCLESASNEYELGELHEGVKKTIASKILGLEMNAGSKDPSEEFIINTLRQLVFKSIESFIDVEYKRQIMSLLALISEKSHNCDQNKMQQISDIIRSLNLDAIKQENEESPRQVATPPPKARGRPKKKPPVPAPATSSDGNIHKESSFRIRLSKLVFYVLLEFMFTNYLAYMRNTKSRILVNLDNPIVEHMVQESSKSSSSQRSSRSKQSNLEVEPSPAKKAKLDPDKASKPSHFRGNASQNSPLNSQQSKKADQQVLWNLSQARKCLDFLNTKEISSISSLWQQFAETYNLHELEWFKRFQIDSSILLSQHREAIDLSQTLLNLGDRKPLDASSFGTTSDMRRLTQLVSNYVQLGIKSETLIMIEYLLSTMKRCGLLVHDEDYINGNIMMEYMITVEGNLGFLFLDTLSMIRFCLDILIEILERHVQTSKSITDTDIGHSIVLSQFDWPKEAKMYMKCMDWIRSNKPKSTTPQYLSPSTKFSYPNFFQFIRNPNIIEDFMALLCQGYTLDIKETNELQTTNTGSHSSPGKPLTSRSGKAITTRGVNKTFKEDLKIAMVTQMKCSSILISLDMISEFIRCSVLPHMNKGKR